MTEEHSCKHSSLDFEYSGEKFTEAWEYFKTNFPDLSDTPVIFGFKPENTHCTFCRTPFNEIFIRRDEGSLR